jgi:hypothetical protein
MPQPALFGQLREALSRPSPDPDQVAGVAAQAAKQLDDCLAEIETRQFQPETVKALFASLQDRVQGKSTISSWDEAAQLYLGMQALHQAMKNLDWNYQAPATEIFLRAMRERLAFPPGYASPRGFDPYSARRR